MADKDKLSFNIELEEIDVELTEEGVTTKYVLRELKGSGRDKYLNNLAKKMKVDVHGNSSVRDFTGLQSGLICRCMFEANGESVTDEFVQGLPSRVQASLFAAIQKMNALDVDEDKSGND